jgi:hypothetical protein
VARVISFFTDKVNTYFLSFFGLLFNHEWTRMNTNSSDDGDDSCPPRRTGCEIAGMSKDTGRWSAEKVAADTAAATTINNQL